MHFILLARPAYMMNLPEEKRHFTRVHADCRMDYRLIGGDTTLPAECINMSGSGILFYARQMVELGKALEIRVEPKSSVIPAFMAFVEVLRCVHARSGDYLIAGAIKGIKSE